jgi:preprotein translocase subunit SecG
LYSLILGIHIIVCLLLVIVVLLQSGKAADLAGAFGGMGSQSTFGPRGSASFLSKLTTTLAVLFMVTSLSLWILASNRSAPKTVVDGVQQEQTTPTTQTPAATETEKATQTGEQQTDKPAAATTEPGTSQKKNSSDTQKKESGQEKPPDSTDSKQ